MTLVRDGLGLSWMPVRVMVFLKRAKGLAVVTGMEPLAASMRGEGVWGSPGLPSGKAQVGMLKSATSNWGKGVQRPEDVAVVIRTHATPQVRWVI